MFVVDALPIVAIVVAVQALRRWLFRERVKTRAPLENGVYVLRNGRVSGYAALGVAFFVAIGWVEFYVHGAFQSSDDIHLSELLFAIVMFVVGAVSLNAFAYRYEVGAVGIKHTMLWRTKSVEWSSVNAIKSTYVPYVITLRCKDGTVMHLSLSMRGSGTLVEHLLAWLPVSVFASDPELRLRLMRLRDEIRF